MRSEKGGGKTLHFLRYVITFLNPVDPVIPQLCLSLTWQGMAAECELPTQLIPEYFNAFNQLLRRHFALERPEAATQA